MKEIREILIIKNIEREGSGLLGEIIAEHGIRSRVIDLSLGEKPEPLLNPGALVVLGGPDSANDQTEKMKLLATGNPCRNQIVKIGSNAYGAQCHFEVTEEMLGRWMNEDRDLMQLDKNELRRDFISFRDAYNQTGRRLFLNFLRIAGYPV